MKSETVSLTEQQEKLIGKKERIKDLKVRLYTEYRSGGTREAYLQKKTEAEERLAVIEKEIDDFDKRLERVRENDIKSLKTSNAISDIKGICSFDKEKLKKVIDRVVVYGPDKIGIVWRAMDEIFGEITGESGPIEV